MLISGAGLVLCGEALAIAGYRNKIVTFVLIPAGVQPRFWGSSPSLVTSGGGMFPGAYLRAGT
jgi:hypothetical protein